MTKEKIKDVLIRAGKTFAQAFISALSVDALFGATDFTTLKRIGITILIAAGAAGVSAVWNMVLNFIYKKIDEIMPTEEELTKALEGGEDDDEN